MPALLSKLKLTRRNRNAEALATYRALIGKLAAKPDADLSAAEWKQLDETLLILGLDQSVVEADTAAMRAHAAANAPDPSEIAEAKRAEREAEQASIAWHNPDARIKRIAEVEAPGEQLRAAYRAASKRTANLREAAKARVTIEAANPRLFPITE